MKNEKTEEKPIFPLFYKNDTDGKVLKRNSPIEVVVFQMFKTKHQVKFSYTGLKLSEEEIDQHLQLYEPCQHEEYQAVAKEYKNWNQRLIDNISRHL